MFIPVSKVLFCIALCLVLVSCWGCDTCREYQDVARVDLFDLYDVKIGDNHVDSIVMKATDSDLIIGCKYILFNGTDTDIRVIGSKTHRVKFPIHVRLQLFSQGNLLKELFLKADRKMLSKISKGDGCSNFSRTPPVFLADDYCLYTENMGDFPGYDYDDMSCIESTGSSQIGPCEEQ